LLENILLENILLEDFFLNLLSPSILFFILGASAGLLKSDLTVPQSMGKFLGTYLMMSIGFKGGVSASAIDSFTHHILLTVFSGIFLSFTIPFLGYIILNLTTELDKPTSAALSSHYGSVSIVTFAAAINFLQANQAHYSGYMPSILALMEAPAILSGLYLAHRVAPETNRHKKEQMILAKEIFTNGAVLLILGSFIVGAISGKSGLDKVAPFFVEPFQGIICMFLLDCGLVVTSNIQNLRIISLPVIMFGIYMPLICASLGLILSYLIGLSQGDALLFIILSASSSYIAVPAAMRLALPEAKSSIYIPISLGITFPINIILGIPLYYSIVKFCL
jgi:uncharacterized protein